MTFVFSMRYNIYLNPMPIFIPSVQQSYYFWFLTMILIGVTQIFTLTRSFFLIRSLHTGGIFLPRFLFPDKNCTLGESIFNFSTTN